jgi:hypothetical protein
MVTKLKTPLVTLVALLLGTGSTVFASDVELKLLCDKSTYLVAEPIWIDILVINHSPDTQAVPFASVPLDEVRFTVVNNGTDTLDYRGLILDAVEGMRFDLSPGDTLYGLFNFVEGYRYSRSRKPFYYKLLQGQVSITARYNRGMVSPTLLIDIVEPTGSEAEAFQLLQEGLKAQFSDKSRSRFEEILERFPNSVYADLALERLIGYFCTHVRDADSCRNLSLELMDRYPNSGFVAPRSMLPYLGGFKSDVYNAKADSLMAPDKPFRLRMIGKNMKRHVQHF